ncbi:restriction endonuclease subunit S [Tolypothrix sp. VBCCA 56010]|uniref:restriction endonuclease subunit S n=1 Tax=Tolypothrix sp. VBCCA 56010 TaxID=3137731 RepID=UPI003D7D9A81
MINILVPMVDSEIQSAISKFLEVVRKRQDGSFEELPELPPPLEQRRIVARVEELVGKIEEVRSLRQKALEETEVLRISSAKVIFNELTKADTQPLRELVTVQGGGTPSKQNPFFWEGSIPWISPKDMKCKEINDSIDHISEEATLKSSAKLLKTNSILIVVRGMILAHTVPLAILKVPAAINQDMKALIPNEKITPEYLCCVLWTFNDLLLALVEKSTHDTRKLETPKLLNFKIPVPPLPEQRRIVAYLDELQTKVDTIKRLREEAMKELDALLPSILDKAFKGEL